MNIKEKSKYFWKGYILAKEEDVREASNLNKAKSSQIKRVKKKIEKENK